MVRHEIASGEYNLRRASCERSVDAVLQCLPNIRALRDLTLDDLGKERRVLWMLNSAAAAT